MLSSLFRPDHLFAPVGRVPLWAFAAIFLAAYVASALIALELVRHDLIATAWPAVGVALAGVLLAGFRIWPLLLAAELIVVAFGAISFVPSQVLGNVIGPLAGAWLYRLAFPGLVLPRRLSQMAWLLFVAGGVTATLTALIGTAGLALANVIPDAGIPLAFASWWLGDLLGLIAFTPLCLLLGARLCRLDDRAREGAGTPRLEQLGALALFGAALFLLLWITRFPDLMAIPVFLACFVSLIWMALRLPAMVTYAAVALTTLVGAMFGSEVILLNAGLGPDAKWLVLLPTLLVLAATPLLIEAGGRERDFYEARLRYQSVHDPLTGLLNRRAFQQTVQGAISRLEGRGGLSLCYLDLDQFKTVNDTLGHSTGDEMLQELAERMRADLGPDEVLARLGGDEFGLLLPGHEHEDTRERLQRLRECIESYRFVRRNRSYAVHVSMGVVPITRSNADYEQLLALADAACFAAKEGGGDRIHILADDIGTDGTDIAQMEWLPVIQQAIDSGSVELYGQRAVSLEDGNTRTAFVEVLTRLRDGRGKLVRPEDFIPVAERFGLMEQLDRVIVSRVLEWVAKHESDRYCFFVNLSGASIGSESFREFLLNALRQQPFPTGRIGIEITETAAVRNLEAAEIFIHELRELGCRIALDDFGTGLSSFAYLHRLEVDLLKVDGRFVQGMVSEPMDDAIVAAMSDLGTRTGIETVGEQVEQAETAEAARRRGLGYAQGYFFGRPRPLDEWARELGDEGETGDTASEQ